MRNSPFELVVGPQTIEARFCRASGEGLHAATSGQTAAFEILALDRHGNPCGGEGGEDSSDDFGFSVLLSYVQAPQPAVTAVGSEPRHR